MLTDLMTYGGGDGSTTLHWLHVALATPTPVILSTPSPVISPATTSAVVSFSSNFLSPATISSVVPPVTSTCYIMFTVSVSWISCVPYHFCQLKPTCYPHKHLDRFNRALSLSMVVEKKNCGLLGAPQENQASSSWKSP